MGLFLPGPLHPNWRGGKTLNTDGYIKVTAGPNRDKYEHRVIANDCLIASYGRGLRADEEVHHQNFIRSCNHDFNLIIMDEALHHGISSHKGRRKGKKYGERKQGPRLQERRASNAGTNGEGGSRRRPSACADAD